MWSHLAGDLGPQHTWAGSPVSTTQATAAQTFNHVSDSLRNPKISRCTGGRRHQLAAAAAADWGVLPQETQGWELERHMRNKRSCDVLLQLSGCSQEGRAGSGPICQQRHHLMSFHQAQKEQSDR